MAFRASDLGERALIARLTARLTARQAAPRNLLGLADDAAAMPLPGADPGVLLVASVDALARSTHFPDAMTPRQMGRMAAAVSLSDLAAKGAAPLGLLVALGAPPDTGAAAVEEVAEGLAAMAAEADAEVLGGDTKAAKELTLAVTALGTVPRDRLLPRAGIRPGDALAVTGTLGGAGAGLAALERGLGPALARRLLEPVPRLAEGRALAASGGAARACMDLSDGLAASLHQFAAANPGVGFEVEEAALPLDPLCKAVASSEVEARAWALQAGGDYELLVAVPAGRTRDAVLAVEQAGGALTVIGRATSRPGVRVRSAAGMVADLPDRGWDAFRGGAG